MIPLLFGTFGYPFGFGYPATLGGGAAGAVPSTTVVTSPYPI